MSTTASRFRAAALQERSICCASLTAWPGAQFDLPTRLRQVDVPRAEMGQLAAHVAEVMGRAAVDRPVTAADVAAVLAAAY